MAKIDEIKTALEICAKPEKTADLQRFFKTGKGEYGAGDRFLGVMVPDQRTIAKKYRDLPLTEVQELVESEFHEERLTGFLILTYKFEKADERIRREIFNFYFRNRKYANNWDIVDVTAPKIIGTYLLDKKRDILYKLARSKSLWDRRIAMVSTWALIRKEDFGERNYGKVDWTDALPPPPVFC